MSRPTIAFYWVMRKTTGKGIRENNKNARVSQTLVRNLLGRVFLGIYGQFFGGFRVSGRNVSRPRLSRFRLELRGLARDRRDGDEMAAARALDLSAGKLLVTLQVL